MENWFKNNPFRSMFVYTILISTFTWAISTFILEGNKINNLKNIIELYKSKVENLEGEIQALRSENKKYFDWLLQTPKTIPFLESNIRQLETEKTKLIAEITNLKKDDSKPIQQEIPKQLYVYSKDEIKGNAFIDPITGAILGISDMLTDNKAYGTLSLPGQSNIELDRVGPGKSWRYSYSGKKYQLSITKINWSSNTFRVEVREIEKD